MLGNGLNSCVLAQAWLLISQLAVQKPNLTIYLTELAGQGLTHLKKDPETQLIYADSLTCLKDPFKNYSLGTGRLFISILTLFVKNYFIKAKTCEKSAKILNCGYLLIYEIGYIGR